MAPHKRRLILVLAVLFMLHVQFPPVASKWLSRLLEIVKKIWRCVIGMEILIVHL